YTWVTFCFSEVLASSTAPRRTRSVVSLATWCSAEAFGLNAPRGALRDELATLSALYERHLLRYASGLWQLVDLGTVGYDRVLRRLCAMLRLLRRWEANIDDRGTI